jgi:hypothetical protein
VCEGCEEDGGVRCERKKKEGTGSGRAPTPSQADQIGIKLSVESRTGHSEDQACPACIAPAIGASCDGRTGGMGNPKDPGDQGLGRSLLDRLG